MDGVIVRLEVEEMRHQILHAFEAHNVEMEAIVSEATRKALNEFSLSGEAYGIARRVVSDLVEQQIESSLRAAFEDPELQAKINEIVKGATGL